MISQSVNPYHGEILTTFEEFTEKEFEAALETAATCFETWRHTTSAGRSWSPGPLAVRRYQELGLRMGVLCMGIQEFVNKKLVRVASIDAPA